VQRIKHALMQQTFTALLHKTFKGDNQAIIPTALPELLPGETQRLQLQASNR